MHKKIHQYLQIYFYDLKCENDVKKSINFFSILQVVQNIDVKIETFGVKKLFTEIQVLVFLLWVIIFGIFNAFIWYYVFL